MKHRLRNLLMTCATVGLLAISRDARGQVTPAEGYTPPDDTPKVNVGGVIFADYTYQDVPTALDADKNVYHPNAFNIGRAYINVTGQINHWIAFRVTPDVTRQTVTGSGATVNTNGSLVYRLKYAYGQVNFDDFATKGSWLRLGEQQTPYIDFIDSIYRYRFQGTTFADREGFLSSSDLGLSTRYVFPGNYGDVHLGVYNGETYTSGETNDQKAFQARVSVRPTPMAPLLRGLRLTGFYDGDHYVQKGERKRFVGALSFEHAYGNVGIEYLDAKDRTSVTKAFSTHGTGFSAWITPRTPIGIEALLRYDELKPNRDHNLLDPDGKKKRTIVGVAYWFPVTKAGVAAAVLADYENVKYDGFAAGSSNDRPEEKRYALHTLFSF